MISIECLAHLFCLMTSTDNIITPHAQRERGKVIGRGVHYIYMSVVEKNFLIVL